MDKIQRYCVYAEGNIHEASLESFEDSDGEWVKWEDVAPLLKQLEILYKKEKNKWINARNNMMQGGTK